MKTATFLLIALCSLISFGQAEQDGAVIIEQLQNDDAYYAGESIILNAPVQGDLVIAGGNLTLNDSVVGDLTAAGGELFVNNFIADDARLAVGRVTIDSEVGDDLVVFGGEIILTKNAVIKGNLKCTGGTVKLNGEVAGTLNINASDVLIDGTVREHSKIVADEITLGSNAKFYKDVQYWHNERELDFKNSLVDARAEFDQDLKEENSQTSLTTFGTKSLSAWLKYLLTALLGILVFHALFKHAFSTAVEGIENNWLKSFGFGLLYLIGIPLLIIVGLLITIGVPLGLFAAAVFVFSLLFGQLIAGILLAYYVRHKKDMNWGFWPVTFIALGFVLLMRLLATIPYVGIVVSVVILAITYGALTIKVFRAKKQRAIN